MVEPLDATSPLERDRGLAVRLSNYVAQGLRYWEPRRLLYNCVLSMVVVVHFALAWPASRATLSLDFLLSIFFLAVLANVAYCAAYLADLFVQFSGLDPALRWGRLLVLTTGTAFAATITHFFAKMMFGA